MDKEHDGPAGIGGWLLLPALGLILTPFRMCFHIYNEFLPIFSNGVWSEVTDPESPAYHVMWGPLIAFEVIANVAMLALTLWLLWLFFSKSVRTPRIFIFWLAALVAVQVIDSGLASLIPQAAEEAFAPDAVREIVRSLVGAAIWIPYFLRSVRVKNTFTRPV
jgi:hypothetical protein